MSEPSEHLYIRLPEDFGDLDHERQLDWMQAILGMISPNAEVRAEYKERLTQLAHDAAGEA
jgi:hypothetical protein